MQFLSRRPRTQNTAEAMQRRVSWLMLAEGHLMRVRFSAMSRGLRSCRFRQTERPMAELANRIARNERGGTGVGEIEQNGSRRRRRVHDGRGSSVFSSANVVLVLQSASGAMQLQGFRAEKGDSGFKTSTYSVVL